MKKRLLLSSVAILVVSSIYAAQPDINSEPVVWADAHIEGPKLILEGTFSIALPNGEHWRKKGAAIGPTGSPINMWDCMAADGSGTGLFVVMDVAIDKVPESERDGFTSTLAKAFRRTGIEAMKRKGYTLDEFKIEDFKSKWPRSVRALSRFSKGSERQVNITYFFPAGRLYIVGYEGTSSDEPLWFVAARRSFDCRCTRLTRRQSQRPGLSRLLLTQEPRQPGSWLIFDVRPKMLGGPDSYFRSIRARFPKDQAKLTAFPSGAFMIDIRIGSEVYVVEPLPGRGFGVSRQSTAVFGWEAVENAFATFDEVEDYLRELDKK